MIHGLKCYKNYFEDITSGRKSFEVRKNDRDYREGDYLALNEVDANGIHTGRSCMIYVEYILSDEDFCKEGYVIMAIVPCAVHINKEEIDRCIPVPQKWYSVPVLERRCNDDNQKNN